MGWISLMFFLMGMMGSCYGLFSLHVVAMEVFPTTSRNSLTNLATTVGRLGGVLAPQTPLLVKKYTFNLRLFPGWGRQNFRKSR